MVNAYVFDEIFEEELGHQIFVRQGLHGADSSLTLLQNIQATLRRLKVKKIESRFKIPNPEDPLIESRYSRNSGFSGIPGFRILYNSGIKFRDLCLRDSRDNIGI